MRGAVLVIEILHLEPDHLKAHKVRVQKAYPVLHDELLVFLVVAPGPVLFRKHSDTGNGDDCGDDGNGVIDGLTCLMLPKGVRGLFVNGLKLLLDNLEVLLDGEGVGMSVGTPAAEECCQ